MGVAARLVGGVVGVAVSGPVYATVRALGANLALGATAAAVVSIAVFALVPPRLPKAVDELAARHRGWAVAWLVLACIGGANLARVSHFMVDANATAFSGAPDDEFFRTHNCLTAYYRAAIAQRDGAANIYDPSVYWGHDDEPESVRMIGPFPIDLYEYPPPFLLPARAALAVSDDFMAWRAAWFGFEALLLVVSLVVLAHWIGGREGLWAGLLAPAVLFAPATILTLQIQNFQLALVAMVVLALVAIERDRPAIGGALLGLLVVAKIFPGLLAIYLIGQRRWRAVIAMAVAGVIASVVAFTVVGYAPFHAFITFQLPRMADGSAFPWLQDYVPAIAANHSVFGVVLKLRALGVPGMGFGTASVVAWIYTLVVIAIAFVLGRRGSARRSHQALVWLGLLQLAVLRSPFAPDVYAVLVPVWIACLLAVHVRSVGRALLAAAWLAMNAGVMFLSVTQEMNDELRFALTGSVQLAGFVLVYVALRMRDAHR